MRQCAHEGRVLALAGRSNGVGLWCDTCAKWVTKEVGAHGSWALPKGHPLLSDVVRESLQRVYEHAETCEICRKETTTPELHHWCPQAIYRDNPPPQGGPVAWLCPACHGEWHALVTPLLVGGMSPEGVTRFLRGIYRRGGLAGWRRFMRVVLDADEAVKSHRATHDLKMGDAA